MKIEIFSSILLSFYRTSCWNFYVILFWIEIRCWLRRRLCKRDSSSSSSTQASFHSKPWKKLMYNGYFFLQVMLKNSMETSRCRFFIFTSWNYILWTSFVVGFLKIPTHIYRNDCIERNFEACYKYIFDQ